MVFKFNTLIWWKQQFILWLNWKFNILFKGPLPPLSVIFNYNRFSVTISVQFSIELLNSGCPYKFSSLPLLRSRDTFVLDVAELFHALLMLILILPQLCPECFRTVILKINEYCESLRSWGNCLLGCSYKINSTNPHITVPLLIWCGYSHHFCWSGWHLVCVISGVSQSCRLLSTHWMTKATDSGRPIAFSQMGMLRNCIHQLRVGREVRNCAALN